MFPIQLQHTILQTLLRYSIRRIPSAYLKEPKKDLDNLINEKYRNFYKLYTDGSKEGTHAVGCSAMNMEANLAMTSRLHNFCTIFEAEAQAIMIAISHIAQIKPHKAVIISDSESVLIALSHPDVKGS